ncbi:MULTISPECIES: transporter substrate-binding domain-containing protein [unclassified Pseudoalteromonas]|uniref:transporter substrate-binding domain-containing protein n=1 Tax=unclassified Pseudoalteromonas TaxID=194690 RepID=UPI00140BA224|nr:MULTISPECIES: transporter substrate-binding domain-containing protein [unclassified Pseudoalteromonas]MBH0026890.1 transporter substrate-binding domain-containing protein [Pseudoalteromonas sp. SWN29]MBH0036999.1 transporter substrate-binding domain-containing protein [Pseudoalteromonas sp. SWN166]
MNRRFSILLLLVNLFFIAPCFSHQYNLTFNRPQSTPQADYALELLKLAYADIGFKIHIIDFSRQNALLAANNGVLDGQLGRDISVEENYENLIRVDYELFKFDLVLYKNCLPRSLEQLDSVAIVDGYPVQEHYLASTQFAGNIIKVKSMNAQLNLLAQQKVQGALMINFIMQNNDLPTPQGCFEKEVLSTYPLYHYLNKRNKNLVEKLKMSLINLTDNGTVYALRAKYGLSF